jgi:hypothetical protein
MLDSLSANQLVAYNTLELGPVWVSRAKSPDAEPANYGLCLVFKGYAGMHSSTESVLLSQLLSAARLSIADAMLLGDDSLSLKANYETLIGFDLTNQIDSFVEKDVIKATRRINLPSLVSMASDSKKKALAWKALKAYLLS